MLRVLQIWKSTHHPRGGRDELLVTLCMLQILWYHEWWVDSPPKLGGWRRVNTESYLLCRTFPVSLCLLSISAGSGSFSRIFPACLRFLSINRVILIRQGFPHLPLLLEYQYRVRFTLQDFSSITLLPEYQYRVRFTLQDFFQSSSVSWVSMQSHIHSLGFFHDCSVAWISIQSHIYLHDSSSLPLLFEYQCRVRFILQEFLHHSVSWIPIQSQIYSPGLSQSASVSCVSIQSHTYSAGFFQPPSVTWVSVQSLIYSTGIFASLSFLSTNTESYLLCRIFPASLC